MYDRNAASRGTRSLQPTFNQPWASREMTVLPDYALV
jgi:hypothetical protein